MELDYLAPFLARIGNPEKLTRGDASKVREECLGDLKQRLIDKANLIQARFEKVLLLLLLSQSVRVGYRGRQGKPEPILDFAERHRFRLSCPNFGKTTLNSGTDPTPK